MHDVPPLRLSGLQIGISNVLLPMTAAASAEDTSFLHLLELGPNARHQARLAVEARHERTLAAVACTPWLDRAFPRGFRIGTPCGGIAQRLDDMADQSFPDVSMPRHGLGHPSDRIAVPVMLTAMAHQDTTEPLYPSDQIDPLHDTTNSSTLRMPDNSSLVRS